MSGQFGRWALVAVGSAVTAEFLLGDQYLSASSFAPAKQLSALVAFVAFYGSAAVLVREVSRRTGRGWPTMLLLTFAFGVVEEGLLTQSLFDPDYLGFHKTAYGLVPALGIGIPWTIFVLTLHVVWSIGAPVAVAEAAFAEPGSGRPRAWFSRKALVGFAILYAGLTLAIRTWSLTATSFRASASQTVVVVVIALVAVLVAFRMPTAPDRDDPSPVTRSGWRDGVVGFVCLGVFQLGHELGPAWLATSIMLVSLGALVGYIVTAHPSPGALGASALATYAWVGLANAARSGLGVGAVVEQVVLVVVVIGVLAFLGRRLTSRTPIGAAAHPSR